MTQPGNKTTVYIVDNDNSVRSALDKLLKTQFYNVQTFNSAQDFLSNVRITHPSCMLMEISMPDMDGLELQYYLKENGHALPIIFISSNGSVDQSVNAMKSGAVDFIEKPIDPDRLLDSISAALELDSKRSKERLEQDELQTRVKTLTRREHDVFLLVLQGMLNKQIAHELGISEKTVKIHRARMMHKCRAKTIAELVHIYGKLATV